MMRVVNRIRRWFAENNEPYETIALPNGRVIKCDANSSVKINGYDLYIGGKHICNLKDMK